jgi:methylmalonyl-CoA epimerase
MKEPLDSGGRETGRRLATNRDSDAWKVVGIDHIGIAVMSLAEPIEMFRDKFGLTAVKIAESKDQKLKVGVVDIGNCFIELMEPTDDEGVVAKFLARSGGRNTLHHIAFAVDKDLNQVKEGLKSLGVEMVYPSPRIGIMGHPVNFCYPKFTSGILIELCDTSGVQQGV